MPKIGLLADNILIILNLKHLNDLTLVNYSAKNFTMTQRKIHNFSILFSNALQRLHPIFRVYIKPHLFYKCAAAYIIDAKVAFYGANNH